MNVVYSQIGINTDAPNATMDIAATPSDLSKIDGLIAPRIKGSELKAKDPLYLSAQTGAIVYVTEALVATATSAKTINVTGIGYFYFDGNVWQKVSGGPIPSEPWNVAGTSTQATLNSQNIYQSGNVGIGDFSASAPTKKLEVKGDFKSEVVSGTISYGAEVNSPYNPGSGMHYWNNSANGNYRITSANSTSASLAAKTGSTTNTIAAEETQATLSSQNGTNSLSIIRSLNTGNFYMESYNVASNFGSTIALQNDGLRLVHTTTAGSGNPFPTINKSEILIQKENGIGFDMRNATGAVKANYWFPLTSGTAGQIMSQTAAGRMVWSNPATFALANNGLTKNTTSSEIELGGKLNKPTVITTDATNTLTLAGLQSGTASDRFVVADENGVLKALNPGTYSLFHARLANNQSHSGGGITTLVYSAPLATSPLYSYNTSTGTLTFTEPGNYLVTMQASFTNIPQNSQLVLGIRPVPDANYLARGSHYSPVAVSGTIGELMNYSTMIIVPSANYQIRFIVGNASSSTILANETGSTGSGNVTNVTIQKI